MMRANIKHLKENGPTPVDEIPYQRIEIGDKLEGAAVFKGPRVSMPPTSIAYLFQEHDKTTVVSEWCNANHDAIKNTKNADWATRFSALGNEWSEAFKEEFGNGRGSSSIFSGGPRGGDKHDSGNNEPDPPYSECLVCGSTIPDKQDVKYDPSEGSKPMSERLHYCSANCWSTAAEAFRLEGN